MDSIEWDESYSVGIAKLDEQHKGLFRLLNTLYECEDLSVNSQVIADLLNDMTEYASLHFDIEERYMYECEYPELAAHIRAHDTFRKKVDELQSAIMATDREMPSKMIRFLFEWLVNHIMFCDKKYAPYITGHQQGGHEKETTTASNDIDKNK